MTDSAMRNEIQEPWKARDSFPKVSRSNLIFCVISVALAALSLSLWQHEQVVFFLLLGLVACTVRLVRKPIGVLPVLLAAVLVSMMTMSLVPAMLFLSMVLGTGATAFLLTVFKRKHTPILLLIPTIAAVIGWIVSGDAVASLLSFAFAPAAVLLAVATVTHQRRTTAICFTLGGFILSFAVVLGVLLYRLCGSLDPDVISAYFEQLRVSVVEFVRLFGERFVTEMQASFAADGYTEEEIRKMVESVQPLFSPTFVNEIWALMTSLLPAMIAVTASVLAFEAQLILNYLYFNCSWTAVLTPTATVFTMSVPAAILYILGFLCAMFLGAGSLFGAAMQNICLILLPGFCVVGWGTMLFQIRSAKGGMRLFLVLLYASAACCTGVSILYFLALWGAFSAIMTAIRLRMIEQMKNGHNSGDPGDE